MDTQQQQPIPMREKEHTNVSDAATTTPNALATSSGPSGDAVSTSTATPAAPTAATPAPAAPADAPLDADERAELARLRDVHKDEQKWRREATELHGPASAYKKLLEGLGVDPAKPDAKDFDAKSAFEQLNSKFESERVARWREQVARTEGVEPEDFTGNTEEEMRASAQRFKARVAAEVEKRAPVAAPAAAPAAVVTSSTPIDGPKPITSRDELKKMSREERMKAHREGRMDDLAAGRTT